MRLYQKWGQSKGTKEQREEFQPVNNVLQRLSGPVGSIRANVPDDMFLVAGSFEPRSVSGAELLARGAADRCALFQYEDTLDNTAGMIHTSELKALLRERSIRPPDVMLCQYAIPSDILRLFQLWFEAQGLTDTGLFITIDTTCFTKLHLILLFDFLRTRIPDATVRILHTEPLVYASALGRSLSYGVKDTVYLPLLPGKRRGTKSALLAFLGHEDIRVERVAAEIEPDETVLILGRPGYSAQMLEISETSNRHLIRQTRFSSQYSLSYCPTRDYPSVARSLASLVSHLSKKGIDSFYIAPLGTKLQAIGLSYFCSMCRDARVIVAYSMPERYEKAMYSQGVGSTYQAILDFSVPVLPWTVIEWGNDYYIDPLDLPGDVLRQADDSLRNRILLTVLERHKDVIRCAFDDPTVSTAFLHAGAVVETLNMSVRPTDEMAQEVSARYDRLCYPVTRDDLQKGSD